MRIGYLRVSTQEQRPDRQIDGLTALCDELHIEKMSAATKKRPIYQKITRKLRAGDALVVWDLDRAFRSTVDAVTEAEKLLARGIDLHIVTLQVDTSSDAGMLSIRLWPLSLNMNAGSYPGAQKKVWPLPEGADRASAGGPYSHAVSLSWPSVRSSANPPPSPQSQKSTA